jgi:hypothetical protein
MTAIVTKNQRIENANNFISAYSDSPIQNHLYLWIAKSDYWSDDLSATADDVVETPIDGEYDKAKIYNEMIAMKKVEPENIINTVPTIQWTFGEAYTAWDDNFSEIVSEEGVITYNTIYDKNFYVVTSTYKIYKCLVAGSSVSTVQPTHSGIEPLQYSDGYVWHYIDEISASNALTFYNDSYLPVVAKSSQDPNQTNISGGIFKIVVEDGGSGYTSAPTVTIEGNGTGAVATATISNGSVSSVSISLTAGIIEAGKYGLRHGTGYDYAKVKFSGGGGTGAKARVVLSPKNGHGYDPISELGAYNVQVAVDINTDESGDFMVSNDYRKIGLIKNPYAAGSSPSEISTVSTLNCLKNIEVNSGTFSPNDVIRDTITSAYAFVDYFDSDNMLIYYHQNEKTGYDSFGVGNAIECADTSETGVIQSMNESEYEPFTGDILLIENRDAIQRSSTTREEIRMVIQF